MAKKDEREEFIKKHPNVTARETPNSYEAEVALLGGIMVDANTAAKYLSQLDDDDFYSPGHRHIFHAMIDNFGTAHPVDLVTTVNTLEANGTLDKAGGVQYVSGLVNAMPSVANVEYYFGILKKNSRLRAMIRISQKMADAAYALDPEDKALPVAESELFALSEKGRGGARLELINSVLDVAIKDLDARQRNADAYRGVPSGFKYLDMILGGGFQKSDLIILAARPGQGKTSFAMNCAVNAALARRPDNKKPYTVAVFELEMGKLQLAKRMLCSVGGVDMSLANRAAIKQDDWTKLFAAQKRFEETKLYVLESGDVTPAEILSMCRALKQSQGLDFVMIDYLQLMKSGMRTDNYVREIAEITRALKLAAKELNVPILLLSQMSRDIEKRKGDPVPQLSDLRDSGAIEQDADIVLFLDRSAKKEESDSASDDAPDTPGNVVYLNIAKHRNGETGSVKLIWDPATVTFRSPNRAPGGLEPPAGGTGDKFYGERYSRDQKNPVNIVTGEEDYGEDKVISEENIGLDDL